VNATGRFSGDPFDFMSKIAVYPNGNSASGDSGAALIRTTDGAVVGVLQDAHELGEDMLAYIPELIIMDFNSKDLWGCRL